MESTYKLTTACYQFQKEHVKATIGTSSIRTNPEFNNASQKIWERIFEQPFKCCRDKKIQSFQFRIIHRIIPCNQWLKNLTIKKCEQCNYCGETDDIPHLFLYCT